LNSVRWRVLADDKLVFYSFMRGVGLPYPRLYGIYHSGGRFFEGVPCFSNAKALAHFLRQEVPYPFFAKPISGSYGHGAATIVTFDSTTDRLLFADGKDITVDQYVTSLSTVPGKGAIFQENLKPHPVVGEICGDRLSTLRLILLLCKDGPAPLRAIWKIPVGRNMTDNFGGGRSGNLCAQLDLHTGFVIAALKGIGLDQREIDLHPDTHKALTGFAIPNWKETMELCAKAASLLPGLRLQSWDIAICGGGPVIVEVNASGGMDLPQHAFRRGFYEGWLRAALARLLSRQGLTIGQLEAMREGADQDKRRGERFTHHAGGDGGL